MPKSYTINGMKMTIQKDRIIISPQYQPINSQNVFDYSIYANNVENIIRNAEASGNTSNLRCSLKESILPKDRKYTFEEKAELLDVWAALVKSIEREHSMIKETV